jgi:hypothetical protein
MASIRNTFLKGVETIFNVFDEAVKVGTYTLDFDNGFDDIITQTDVTRCIFEKFTEKDVELLTFSKLIQPTDIKGLMPSVDIVNVSEVNSQGRIVFTEGTYEVVAFDLDPMSVIYTLLLRKN